MTYLVSTNGIGVSKHLKNHAIPRAKDATQDVQYDTCDNVIIFAIVSLYYYFYLQQLRTIGRRIVVEIVGVSHTYSHINAVSREHIIKLPLHAVSLSRAYCGQHDIHIAPRVTIQRPRLPFGTHSLFHLDSLYRPSNKISTYSDSL